MDYVSAVVNYIRVNSNDGRSTVRGHEIASALRINDVAIRKWINEARSIGIPICSCQNGYYYSEDPEHISDTINKLKNRIAKQQMAIDGLCCRINT